METGPFFIINPASLGGTTGRRRDEVRRAVLAVFPRAQFAITAAPGEATRLAHAARASGFDQVVAVGGDGTINEVVNGLLGRSWDEPASGIEGDDEGPGPASADLVPRLGILPAGSGSDLARTIRIPDTIRPALEVLANGRELTIDVAEMEFRSPAGKLLRRYFANMAGCGASGAVVNRVHRIRAVLGGALGYFVASLVTALDHHPLPARLSVDRSPWRDVPLNVLFVCNGQYCAGGMRVGKGASIDDGMLHVVEIGGVGRLRSLLNSPKLYLGGLERVRGVSVYKAREVSVASSGSMLADCDGEQPGEAPVTFGVVPARLRICAPEGQSQE
jgi:diacylglycerol kinase (ATP)